MAKRKKTAIGWLHYAHLLKRVEELARLGLLEYLVAEKSEAERLGISPETLKKLVIAELMWE